MTNEAGRQLPWQKKELEKLGVGVVENIGKRIDFMNCTLMNKGNHITPATGCGEDKDNAHEQKQENDRNDNRKKK